MTRIRQVYLSALLVAPMLAAGARLVHAAAPAGRYSVAAGVVTDNCTGLHWQQAPSAPLSRADAWLYCQSAAVPPGNGWRLPTIKELQSLVDEASTGYPIDAIMVQSTSEIEADAILSPPPVALPDTSHLLPLLGGKY